MPQAVAIDRFRDPAFRIAALHGIGNRHTQQSAVGIRGQRVDQDNDIIHPQAGASRIMHQHPVTGRRTVAEVMDGIQYGMAAFFPAADTLQPGSGKA
jgi:hypothetical protein